MLVGSSRLIFNVGCNSVELRLVLLAMWVLVMVITTFIFGM